MLSDTDRRLAMTTGTHIATSFEELDYRENDGISVSLRWHRSNGSLTVAVADSRTDERFELAVAPARALDAFRHPFAYAVSGSPTDERPPGLEDVEQAVSELERQTLSYL
jgi:hypothetical protein